MPPFHFSTPFFLVLELFCCEICPIGANLSKLEADCDLPSSQFSPDSPENYNLNDKKLPNIVFYENFWQFFLNGKYWAIFSTFKCQFSRGSGSHPERHTRRRPTRAALCAVDSRHGWNFSLPRSAAVLGMLSNLMMGRGEERGHESYLLSLSYSISYFSLVK